MSRSRRETVSERIVSRSTRMPNGCLVFNGYVMNSGYALVYVDAARGKQLVHRIAYELHFGPIPDGMQIDHVAARGCLYRTCVNPAHLEAVTPLENTRRAIDGNATKTRCVNGHPFDETNTRVHFRASEGRLQRICRRCDADRAQAARERRQAA